MANRKVFTDFQFEGGAQLKFPIAHSDVTEPASKGPGQLWFNSAVGGDPEVGLGTLSVQYAAMSGTSDFRALLTAGVPFTTGGLVTFNNNPPVCGWQQYGGVRAERRPTGWMVRFANQRTQLGGCP